MPMIPLPGRESAPIIRKAMGFDDIPDLAEKLDAVEFDLDASPRDVEAAFEKSVAVDPVIVKRGSKIIARLNMAALAALLMRSSPSVETREAILAWAGRSDIFWCKPGAHFTLDNPCKEHGA